MRPVKRALKMLENPEENTSEKDQVTQTKQVKTKISILRILLERSISAVLSSPGFLSRTVASNQAQPDISCGKKKRYIIKGFKQ